MGRDYYYLSASLPTLIFNQSPPLSLESFISQCEQQMAADDFRKMQQALTNQQPKDPVPTDIYGRWIAFNRGFKNEMAYFRAKRAGKDPQKYLRGERKPYPQFTDAIAHAAKAEDPLSAERILDEVRFEYLEQLAAGQFMNFEYLLTYGLKLKMMTRYARIGSPLGEEVFNSLKQIDIKLD